VRSRMTAWGRKQHLNELHHWRCVGNWVCVERSALGIGWRLGDDDCPVVNHNIQLPLQLSAIFIYSVQQGCALRAAISLRNVWLICCCKHPTRIPLPRLCRTVDIHCIRPSLSIALLYLMICCLLELNRQNRQPSPLSNFFSLKSIPVQPSPVQFKQICLLSATNLQRRSRRDPRPPQRRRPQTSRKKRTSKPSRQ